MYFYYNMGIGELFEIIEETRSTLLKLVIISGLLGTAIFLVGMKPTDSDIADENLHKVVEKTPDMVVPTEISWIQKVTNLIENPYLLLISILGILWFFGYFSNNK